MHGNEVERWSVYIQTKNDARNTEMNEKNYNDVTRYIFYIHFIRSHDNNGNLHVFFSQ